MSIQSMPQNEKSPTVTEAGSVDIETTGSIESEVTSVEPFDTSKIEQITEVSGENVGNAASQGNTPTPELNNNHDVQPVSELLPSKTRPLTVKERAYIEYKLKNPKATNADAVRAVYDVKPDVKKRTLENMGRIISNRPAVLAILTEHATEAEQMLVELAKDVTRFSKSGSKEGAMYAGVAERTLNSMLDRVHGKATQRIEQQSTTVSVSIDMTSSQEDDEVIEQN